MSEAIETDQVVSLSPAARVRGYKGVSGAPDLVSALNQQPVSEAIETDQVVSLSETACTNWRCRC